MSEDEYANKQQYLVVGKLVPFKKTDFH
jgi:hypothetical protein